jgi:hypothetical protein
MADSLSIAWSMKRRDVLDVNTRSSTPQGLGRSVKSKRERLRKPSTSARIEPI